MRTVLCLLVFALLFWSAGTTGAITPTDEEKFQNDVAKSAPENVTSHPPVVCVCPVGGGGFPSGAGGQLIQIPFGISGPLEVIRVRCRPLLFHPDGTLQNSVDNDCDDWKLLPKP